MSLIFNTGLAAIPQQTDAGERKKFRRTPVRLLVGITSDQTCLVLKTRLRSLREAGFAVTLVSSPGERLYDTAEAEGVDAHGLRMTRGIAPLHDFVSLMALMALLHSERPDITDFSTPKAGFLGNLAAWAWQVPHRVYTLRGLKLEATRGIERWILVWTERVACACAHTVLCNSESLGQKALALRLVNPAKLVMLGSGSSNGVDTRRFSPGTSVVRVQLGIGSDDAVLGFVGRLTRDKGVVELLTAFDEILKVHPDTWLLMVGWFDAAEDALDRHWQERIQTHPRILYVGAIEDTVPYYRAMDLLILPTYREGFPNVVLEAAACGVPVIATECTGARDSVISEVTGLLIPPQNATAITDAVLALLKAPERRQRMAMAARKWMQECYEQKKVLDLAVNFYRGLADA